MWLLGLLDTGFVLSGGFRSHGDERQIATELWTIEGCRMLVIEVYSMMAKFQNNLYMFWHTNRYNVGLHT